MTSKFLSLLSGVLLLAAAAIVGYQALEWLFYGDWPSFAIVDLITATGRQLPVMQWQVLQRVVDFLSLTPLSAVLAFIGALAGWRAYGLLRH
ncbi:MAG: hypothetical protein ACHQAY_11560 [Hyphomicrobiales bacterium]